MKWKAAEIPGGGTPDEVTTGLRERYDVDDDGTFEIPDDAVDAAVRRRLEEAGHKPVRDAPDEEDTDSDEAADDGDSADDGDAEAEAEAETVDDEYADMDRSALYELYKDREGPKSWNDTTADELRHDLRVHDETGTFPTTEE